MLCVNLVRPRYLSIWSSIILDAAVTIQGPAEAWPARVWLAGYVNVVHEMDSNLSISPKMSCGVFECDMVMLQNHMLVIL